jgi:uncharacterized protein (TIGR03435 family)
VLRVEKSESRPFFDIAREMTALGGALPDPFDRGIVARRHKFPRAIVKSMMRFILSALLAAIPALAQTPDGQPSFEVASIKPAAPQAPGRMMMGRRGGPGTPDPTRVTFTNASMEMLLMTAFDVKGYQITGPSWLQTEHYDVTAKIPPGTTDEQFRLMLQNLLKERFHMAVHHDSKELPIYALVVAKNGPKLKEAAVEPAPPEGALPPEPPARGKDGFPQLPKGRRGLMFMMNAGRIRAAGNQQSMSDLCNALAMNLDRPVVDQTGLKGKYDFTMDFAPEPGTIAKMKALGPAGAPGGDAGGPAPAPDADSGPSIFTALQEQLGLKLEPKKGPVELIVVDNLEKAPTEN